QDHRLYVRHHRAWLALSRPTIDVKVEGRELGAEPYMCVPAGPDGFDRVGLHRRLSLQEAPEAVADDFVEEGVLAAEMVIKGWCLNAGALADGPRGHVSAIGGFEKVGCRDENAVARRRLRCHRHSWTLVGCSDASVDGP